MDKRTPHQSDQAVSEGLCCNRKKKNIAPSFLGRKPTFFTTGKSKRSVTKLQLAQQKPQLSCTAGHSCARMGSRTKPSLSTTSSTACSPFLPFTARYSLWLKDQQNSYDKKGKIFQHVFFVWLTVFPRRTSLMAELCNTECFTFSLFGKQVPLQLQHKYHKKTP